MGGFKDKEGKYKQFKGRDERNPKTRQKTFLGIAEAMATQWGWYVRNNIIIPEKEK